MGKPFARRPIAATKVAMRAMVRIAERIEPRPALRPRYDALYGVYRELYPATRDLVHRLGDIAQA